MPTGRAANIETESLRAEQYENLLKGNTGKQQEVQIELETYLRTPVHAHCQTNGYEPAFCQGCLAGTHYCIISPKGDVQPCAYLNIPLRQCGKTLAKSGRKTPSCGNSAPLNYKGGCGSCKYKICGGCRARAYLYHDGDYMAEEPWCLYHGGKGYGKSQNQLLINWLIQIRSGLMFKGLESSRQLFAEAQQYLPGGVNSPVRAF